MKPRISAVIIARDEEHIIGKTIDAVRGVVDEVLLYDTGSTDRTIPIAESLGARVIRGEWAGYGVSRKHAIRLAVNDWILNIDSDEVLDSDLRHSIASLENDDPKMVYQFRYRNFLGPVSLDWGDFGFDKHIRLFHRGHVNWNDGIVHEKLLIPAGVRVKRLPGRVLHYTMKDTREFVSKSVKYALLNAEQYYSLGRRATWIKQFVAPAAMFLKYYIIRLGFLDGWAGLFAARMTGFYTYLKYARLRELWEEAARREQAERDGVAP